MQNTVLAKARFGELILEFLWFTYYSIFCNALKTSTLAWKIPWTEEPGRLQSMGVAKSRTWLSDFPFTFHFHALEKEMATHSSVLAWRIPGTGEPGGLPSRVTQSRTRLKRLSSSSSSEFKHIFLKFFICNSIWLDLIDKSFHFIYNALPYFRKYFRNVSQAKLVHFASAKGISQVGIQTWSAVVETLVSGHTMSLKGICIWLKIV